MCYNIHKSCVVAITLANVLGAIIIITILEHYFSKLCLLTISLLKSLSGSVIAAAAICVGYGYFAGFYRESARELKRLGRCPLISVFRSVNKYGLRCYAAFSSLRSLLGVLDRAFDHTQLRRAASVPT